MQIVKSIMTLKVTSDARFGEAVKILSTDMATQLHVFN